jgi:hypothetical protein
MGYARQKVFVKFTSRGTEFLRTVKGCIRLDKIKNAMIGERYK